MPLANLPVLPEPYAAALKPEAELVLYTHGTPNGWKASIALEELGLDYSVVDVKISTGVQKQPWFLQINPNGRIPALHDRRLLDAEGQPLAIFESGAILLHLAEREGALIPAGAAKRAETLSWLMFQMGGLGPMMGQANVFYRYAPEKIQYAIDRYQRESRRLLSVLDTRLADRPFLVGDDYTIADIACWSWAHTHAWSGADVSDLKHLDRWINDIADRPAVKRGMAVPSPVTLPTDGAGGTTTEQLVKAAQGMLA